MECSFQNVRARGRQNDSHARTRQRGVIPDQESIAIGAKTNLQDLTVVHADRGAPTRIGDMVTIGHRAIIHGCTIEDECMIGMGAIVMNRAVVGPHAIVAAGAVVLEDFKVPPGFMVAGVPAKVIRELRPEEIDRIREVAGIYTHETELYLAAGIGSDPPNT